MGGNYLWEECDDWDEINDFIKEEAEKRGLYMERHHAPDSLDEYSWERILGSSYFEPQESSEEGKTMFELEVWENGTSKIFDKILTFDMNIRYPAPKFSCKVDFDKEAFVKFLDSLKK